MNDYLAASVAVGATRSLAHSALPNAPLVPDRPPHTRVRSWLATRLRVLARSTHALANRVDPVAAHLPRHHHSLRG